MLEYSDNIFQYIRSKIGLKVGILVFIQLFFIIISFIILYTCQSDMFAFENSINIAGNNQFLTSNLMYNIYDHLLEDTSDVSTIKTAMNDLESNIMAIKNGGIDLKPLPTEFSKNWDEIYQKWILLKTILTDNILEQNQKIKPVVLVTSDATTGSTITPSKLDMDTILKTSMETGTASLVDSSDRLVTQLREQAKSMAQGILFYQWLFAMLTIGVTSAFVFYILRKILKPIFTLTHATSEVTRGNLAVVIKTNDHGVFADDDELSVLTKSFNSMVTSLKNSIKKQNELTKELENANTKLKERDQLKDEFINIAAHELKTPIQPILGLAELLHNRSSNLENDEEILNVIIRNSKRLMKLAEEILDVARIESGSLFLKKEKFDLNEMILIDILRDYNQMIIENKKNIKLFYKSYDKNPIIVEADKNKLNQVICNLLSNAFNFTNEGSITVIVERKGNEILVSITDTGTGIHPQIYPKLFTAFVSKSPKKGTGLGLFISKSIIEIHGGRIWAFNNGDVSGERDQGSTFTFSLPSKE
jgi:signal transduction histidine kinase